MVILKYGCLAVNDLSRSNKATAAKTGVLAAVGSHVANDLTSQKYKNILNNKTFTLKK